MMPRPALTLDFQTKHSASGMSYILASGEIVSGDSERLERLLHHGQIDDRVIAFNSPGGDLLEAVNIGRSLHYFGFSTYILSDHSCLSACFFSFIGGERRTVELFGRLGVHQFYGGNEKLKEQSSTQYLTGSLLEFVRKVGVSTEAIEIATQTPPNAMYIFSQSQLVSLRIVGRHDNTTFPKREARRLGLSEKEYRARWRRYVESPSIDECYKQDSLARDMCLFALRSSIGLPR